MVEKVQFLSADAVGRTLRSLLDKHDEVHWAVAWGTYSSLAKKLLEGQSKLVHVTFGLAFSHTDPDLVDAMIGVDGCKVVTRFPRGTFHPKVYAFRSCDEVAVVVGSANFTPGGLGNNHEASVLLTGSISDPALKDIFDFVQESAGLGESVTRELADRYRVSCRVAARKPKPARDPLDETPTAKVIGLTSRCVAMTWPQYLKEVRASRFHELDERLRLLQTVQAWLASVDSFEDLSIEQRKAIAGFLGLRDRPNEEVFNQGWEAFGSMKGAGDFMNRVGQNDEHLAQAVDSIPQKGGVTRANYARFVDLFAKAFSGSIRKGGVATATRLLAMKRPDVFLCVSKPNKVAAADAMGFSKNALDLENYWDRVVEVIRESEWYNIGKPAGQDGRIWEVRAAMLDSIYYNPD